MTACCAITRKLLTRCSGCCVSPRMVRSTHHVALMWLRLRLPLLSCLHALTKSLHEQTGNAEIICRQIFLTTRWTRSARHSARGAKGRRGPHTRKPIGPCVGAKSPCVRKVDSAPHCFVRMVRVQEQFSVSYIFCWHSLYGYWAGVSPDTPELAHLSPMIVMPRPSPGACGCPTLLCCACAIASVDMIL